MKKIVFIVVLLSISGFIIAQNVINIVKSPSKETMSSAGYVNKINILKNTYNTDFNLLGVNIREDQEGNLSSEYNVEYKNKLKELYDEYCKNGKEDFLDNLKKVYLLQIFMQSVNISEQYHIPLEESEFISIRYFQLDSSEMIEWYIKNTYVENCKINISEQHLKNITNEIIDEIKRYFSEYYEEKYTQEYCEELIKKYIGEDAHADDGIEHVESAKEYIQIYETYYSYYNEMIEAVKSKDEKKFTDNCVGLYYYIAESSDELTKEEYKDWNKKDIKEDLKSIVSEFIEMFGNESSLKTCDEALKEINYESRILEEGKRNFAYKISKEDMEWGQELFLDYIFTVTGK